MLGVYVHVVKELALVKVPVPFDVHSTVVWLDALEPEVMLIDPVA